MRLLDSQYWILISRSFFRLLLLHRRFCFSKSVSRFSCPFYIILFFGNWIRMTYPRLARMRTCPERRYQSRSPEIEDLRCSPVSGISWYCTQMFNHLYRESLGMQVIAHTQTHTHTHTRKKSATSGFASVSRDRICVTHTHMLWGF